MATATFLDTSAFGRAFEPGPSQAEMVDALRSRKAVMALLALAEARGIVNTKIRHGLDSSAARLLWTSVQQGLAYVRLSPMEADDLQRAQDLMVQEPLLRAADAIHLAVAQGLAADGAEVVFVTADRRQAGIAERILDEVRLLA